MNIIEAIKSGKSFRRKIWSGTHLHEGKCPECCWWPPSSVGCDYSVSVADMIADDWEIEEQRVEITESQLDNAMSKIFSISGMTYAHQTIAMFKRDLGFK